MRFPLTRWLVLLLIASVGFAAWSWLRPYEWSADAAARFRISGAEVVRDHDYYWVTVRLRALEGTTHDWAKPARLLLDDGRELEPADTRAKGEPGRGVEVMDLKFWLVPGQLESALRLRLNDGVLSVKARPGLPSLGLSGRRYFTTNRW